MSYKSFNQAQFDEAVNFTKKLTPYEGNEETFLFRLAKNCIRYGFNMEETIAESTRLFHSGKMTIEVIQKKIKEGYEKNFKEIGTWKDKLKYLEDTNEESISQIEEDGDEPKNWSSSETMIEVEHVDVPDSESDLFHEIPLLKTVSLDDGILAAIYSLLNDARGEVHFILASAFLRFEAHYLRYQKNNSRNAHDYPNKFYEALPDKFDRQTSLKIADKLGINKNPKTIYNWIDKLISKNLVTKEKHNFYSKIIIHN